MKKIKVDIIGSGTTELTKYQISTLAEYADKVTEDSIIEGNVHANAAYAQDIDKLEARFENLHITADKAGMKFADPEVERVLLASTSPKIDADGNGVITKEEVEKITSLPSFTNTAIKNFEELELFENVHTLFQNTFYNCKSLVSVNLKNIISIGGNDYGCFQGDYSLRSIYAPICTSMGASVFRGCSGLAIAKLPLLTSMGGGCFRECTSLRTVILGEISSIPDWSFYTCRSLACMVLKASTPVSVGSNGITNATFSVGIYVPDEAVNAYKSAAFWSTYASKIKPISSLTPEQKAEYGIE